MNLSKSGSNLDKFSHFIGVTFVSYFKVKRSQIDYILVCKILSNGAMGLKLGKILEPTTVH